MKSLVTCASHPDAGKFYIFEDRDGNPLAEARNRLSYPQLDAISERCRSERAPEDVPAGAIVAEVEFGGGDVDVHVFDELRH